MRLWFIRLLWFAWTLIVLLVALAHLFGQRFWVVGMLVYAPPHMWLIFLGLLAVLAWRVHRRLSLLCLGTVLFFAGPLWEWRTHRPVVPSASGAGGTTLHVLTTNRGDHHGHSITAFVNEQHPDLVAMQDAIYAGAWVPNAPEYAALIHQSRVSEFLLLSRFPITQASLLMTKLPARLKGGTTLYKGARFQIDFHGRPVAVYNVHLPSPRRDMHRAVHDPSAATVQDLRQYWSDHTAIIEDFTTRMEAETMPVVVLGDWNQPPIGPDYRLITRQLLDTHTEAGTGYGWTFPGDWWNIFCRGDAWMRLDLVLCSRDWRALSNEVEPESESQHSAVSAVVELR